MRTPAALLVCLLSLPAFADEPTIPATLLAQPDKLLAADALTKDATPLAWKSPKGKWERTAEGVKGEEVPADMHGAVSRIPQALGNFVAAFEFRLDGAKTISLSINDAKEHVARVMITPTTFKVQKDDHDHDGPDKAIVFLNQSVKFEPGTWHSIVLEMVGDTMVATLDGKTSAFGTNELFKSPKASPGFTVGGQSATFRHFAVWEAKAEPKADWKETSAKIAEAMKAAPTPAAPVARKKAAK